MTSPVSASRYLGVFALYCALNLLLFLTIQPYRTVGDELLGGGGFEPGLEDWAVRSAKGKVSLADGILTIDHPLKSTTSLTRCWPVESLPWPLLLSAEGRTQGVVHGTRPWHEARIDLVGYDAAGQGQYQVKTRLFGLAGERDWRRQRRLYQKVPEVSQTVCLEILLISAPGRFQVRGLSLTRAQVSDLHRIGRLLLLAGWLVVLAWLVRPLYHHYRDRRLGSGLLLTTLLLLGGVLLPHELRHSLETVILRVLSGIGISLPAGGVPGGIEPGWGVWPAEWDLSKYSHLLGFALLAALVACDRRSRWRVRISGLLLLAMASEILQFFVPLRTPRLSDWMIDLFGIAIGMGLASIALWHRRL